MLKKENKSILSDQSRYLSNLLLTKFMAFFFLANIIFKFPFLLIFSLSCVNEARILSQPHQHTRAADCCLWPCEAWWKQLTWDKSVRGRLAPNLQLHLQCWHSPPETSSASEFHLCATFHLPSTPTTHVEFHHSLLRHRLGHLRYEQV